MRRLHKMEINAAVCLHIFLLLLIRDSEGQKFKLGHCRNIPAVTNFVPAAFGRTWYEYSRTPSIHGHSLRCNTFVYAYTAATQTFTVRFTAFKIDKGNPINSAGTATLPAGVSSGVLAVLLPNSFLHIFPTNYYVIAIGPGARPRWAILYSCKELGFGKLENIIVLTRLRRPRTATLSAIYSALAALGLSTKDLVTVDQVNC